MQAGEAGSCHGDPASLPQCLVFLGTCCSLGLWFKRTGFSPCIRSRAKTVCVNNFVSFLLNAIKSEPLFPHFICGETEAG